MKLTSTLIKNSDKQLNSVNISIYSENCTLGQAFTMIEVWCSNNDANLPKSCDVWKDKGNIRVQITTRDNNYTNIFNIVDTLI